MPEDVQLIAEVAPELLADRDGVAGHERSNALRSRLQATLEERREHGDTGEVRRLRAFDEGLLRAGQRAVRDLEAVHLYDFDAPTVRPLALPLRQAPDSRSFVLLDAGPRTEEITVFVTAGPATPDLLRLGLHQAHEHLVVDLASQHVQGSYGPRAAAVWQGTDPDRLVRDLATVAAGYPDARIRFVVDGDIGDALVRTALADNRMTAHREQFDGNDSGAVEISRRLPALPPAQEAFLVSALGSLGTSVPDSVPPRPVLPEVPTDPDVGDRAKTLWSNLFGDATAVDADNFEANWGTLSRDERWLLVAGAPAKLAEQQGVPARWRDRANRMLLAKRLEFLRAEDALGMLGDAGPGRDELNLLEDRVAALEAAARRAATMPGHPPVHVLSLGVHIPALGLVDNGRPRRMIAAWGDVDTASRIKVTVVGRLGSVSPADGMDAAADVFDPSGTQASVAYLAADGPGSAAGPEPVSGDELSRAAGRELLHDIDTTMHVQRHYRKLALGRSMAGLEVDALPAGRDVLQSAENQKATLSRDIDVEWGPPLGLEFDDDVVGYRSPDTDDLAPLDQELEGVSANCTTYVARSQHETWPDSELPEVPDAGIHGRSDTELAYLLQAGWHDEVFHNDQDGPTAHDKIDAILRDLGPGATAVVVDEYTHFDPNNPKQVGSHVHERYVAADGVTVLVRNWKHTPADPYAIEPPTATPDTEAPPTEGVRESTVIFRRGNGAATVEYGPDTAHAPGATRRTRIGREQPERGEVAALLAAARAGDDPAASRRLQEIFGRQIFPDVRAMTGSMQAVSLARGAVDDVFATAVQYNWNPPEGQDVRDWLLGIARKAVDRRIAERVRAAVLERVRADAGGNDSYAAAASELRAQVMVSASSVEVEHALNSSLRGSHREWLRQRYGLEATENAALSRAMKLGAGSSPEILDKAAARTGRRSLRGVSDLAARVVTGHSAIRAVEQAGVRALSCGGRGGLGR